MTNEELVQKIKDGDDSCVEQLWLNIKRLAAKQANRFFTAYNNTCISVGVELDDLIQSGFIAMTQAVEGFDKEKGVLFSTYFVYYLTSVFEMTIGRRNHAAALRRLKANPNESDNGIPTCEVDLFGISLDDTLKGETSNDDSSYASFIPDPKAELPMRQIEEADYFQVLQKDLDAALSCLSPKHAQYIRAYYYDDRTYEEIAADSGVTTSYVGQSIRNGLQVLRENSYLAQYKKDLISTHGLKGGFKSWEHSGLSVQERILIALEEKEDYLKRFLH